MTLWWPNAFPAQAHRSWFWALRPGTSETVSPYTEWAAGYYWFYKIPAENGHRIQLAFKSPVDRRSEGWGQRLVKANVIYIVTYPGDTPNWGSSSSLVEIGPPCWNWYSDMYELVSATTRSQTFGLNAAIRANRNKITKVKAAIAKTDSLNYTAKGAIAGNPELEISIRSAISGDAERTVPMRAAIRAERVLEPAIIAAVARDFDLPVRAKAAISGDAQKECRIRAGIKGETQKTVGITAFVVKTRVDKIMLEMENLWPQELDLRSTPNWASKFKDYRKSGLGE